jgi:hypothetical protein
MSKPKVPPPADLAVEARQRGAFAGDNHQPKRKNQLKGSTAQPRGPPDDDTKIEKKDDTKVVEYANDTIQIFCLKNRISVAMYYLLKSQGKGPREMAVGRKRLISHEAAEAWRIEREAEADAKAKRNTNTDKVVTV